MTTNPERLTQEQLENLLNMVRQMLPWASDIEGYEELVTVGAFFMDWALVKLEDNGALEFNQEGQPYVPYVSDYMIESVLTRPETAS